MEILSIKVEEIPVMSISTLTSWQRLFLYYLINEELHSDKILKLKECNKEKQGITHGM